MERWPTMHPTTKKSRYMKIIKKGEGAYKLLGSSAPPLEMTSSKSDSETARPPSLCDGAAGKRGRPAPGISGRSSRLKCPKEVLPMWMGRGIGALNPFRGKAAPPEGVVGANAPAPSVRAGVANAGRLLGACQASAPFAEVFRIIF